MRCPAEGKVDRQIDIICILNRKKFTIYVHILQHTYNPSLRTLGHFRPGVDFFRYMVLEGVRGKTAAIPQRAPSQISDKNCGLSSSQPPRIEPAVGWVQPLYLYQMVVQNRLRTREVKQVLCNGKNGKVVCMPIFAGFTSVLSVPKCTANLYCICLSIPQIFTKADAVQIGGIFLGH